EYKLGRLEVSHDGLRVMIDREGDEAEYIKETKEEDQEIGANLVPVKSPLTGVFYRAPLPGAPPFVEEGDHVEPGTVLCIVEAMKLMNEITSEISGRVAKILPENAQVVEVDQVMFYIDVS
ncbi:MAG: acetyl-CoA carboxylase, biotin carboxyl carrier protein, partial [Candidatus Eremiobacteraeota bacterium]|nr:acetyl-CoA carboxylase, biotin carboxyl carrier protein [Candidatus Eremiobacteraeota bacterium]